LEESTASICRVGKFAEQGKAAFEVGRRSETRAVNEPEGTLMAIHRAVLSMQEKSMKHKRNDGGEDRLIIYK
jgi:hypothetical protein